VIVYKGKRKKVVESGMKDFTTFFFCDKNFVLNTLQRIKNGKILVYLHNNVKYFKNKL